MNSLCDLNVDQEMRYKDVPECLEHSNQQTHLSTCLTSSSSRTNDHFNGHLHTSHLVLVAVVATVVSGLVTGIVSIYCCRMVASHELMNVILEQKAALLRIQYRQQEQERRYARHGFSGSEQDEQRGFTDNLKHDLKSGEKTDWENIINENMNDEQTRNWENADDFEKAESSISQLTDLVDHQEDMDGSISHSSEKADLDSSLKEKTKKRVRRSDKSGVKGQKTTQPGQEETKRKPTGQKQSKKSAFFHLELDIELDPQTIANLQQNGSSHPLEFGTIFKTNTNLGFRTNHENGLIRNWKQPEWSEKHSKQLFVYNEQEGEVSVMREGVYFVYAQIRYYQSKLSGFELRVNTNRGLLKCLEGSDSEHRWRYNTCYVGAVKHLKSGDKLRMLDLYAKTATSGLNPHYIHIGNDVAESNYWGAFQLGL